MQTPILTDDVVEWLVALTDNEPQPKDTADVLRWKAAQRAVGLTVQRVRDSQKETNPHNITNLRPKE